MGNLAVIASAHQKIGPPDLWDPATHPSRCSEPPSLAKGQPVYFPSSRGPQGQVSGPARIPGFLGTQPSKGRVACDSS